MTSYPAADAFREAWHAADAEGRKGERVDDGLRAAFPALLAERDDLAQRLSEYGTHGAIAAETTARQHAVTAATIANQKIARIRRAISNPCTSAETLRASIDDILKGNA